jgi:sugar diacid utilization regulator
VDALYGLTGLPAVVEDSTGRVLVSAGPPGARIRRATFTGRREVVLKDAARSGRPVRADDRLLAVVRPHPDVMGVLMLIDPAGLAGEQESVALEHAATVLAIELARLHGLAETELRLGRNLVSDLVMGGDDAAVARAQVLGHDMRRPQRVMVLGSTRRDQDVDDLLMRVRERIGGSIASAGSAPPPLLMQVDRSLVVIVSMAAAGSALPQDLLQLAGRGGRIGIGGICRTAADYPRSYREAQLAMRLARDARSGSSIVRHEDLGVYQLLAESADPRVLDAFVDRWLGPLVAYDAERSSDLVGTLTAFLEMGGNYDATAERLMLGRSTVRYRIRRVQQLTSHDLSDVETRFQLQLATRARATMRALAETRDQAPSSP